MFWSSLPAVPVEKPYAYSAERGPALGCCGGLFEDAMAEAELMVNPKLAAYDPSICPQVYAPVVGPDGKIYGNSCQLQRAIELAQQATSIYAPSEMSPRVQEYLQCKAASTKLAESGVSSFMDPCLRLAQQLSQYERCALGMETKTACAGPAVSLADAAQLLVASADGSQIVLAAAPSGVPIDKDRNRLLLLGGAAAVGGLIWWASHGKAQ